MPRQTEEKCKGCPKYGCRLALAAQECDGCGDEPISEPVKAVPQMPLQFFPKAPRLSEKFCEACGLIETEAETCPTCGEPLIVMRAPAP